MRAEVVSQIRDKSSRDPAEVGFRELLRIAGHAPFGAPKRHVDHGRLPGHPRGEGAHLVGRHIRVVAKAPLPRPPHLAVEDAMSDKVLYRTLFRLDGKFDGDDPSGLD